MDQELSKRDGITTLVVIGVPLLLFGLGAYFVHGCNELGEPVLSEQLVTTTTGPIHVRCRAEGVVGNKQTAWVTKGGDLSKPNPEHDLVFVGATILFGVEHDTLMIYTRREVPLPRGWDASEAVKQVAVDNPTFNDLRQREGLAACSDAPRRAG